MCPAEPVLAPAPGHPVRKADAEQFLTRLDEDATAFLFAAFDETGAGRPPRTFHGDLDGHWPELDALNADGYGIYVTINATDGPQRKRENIVKVRAVFRDWDQPEATPRPLPLEPSLVVCTSPGKFHDYLFTDDLDLDDFTPVQRRLVQDYGSDPQVIDLPRVMRLPGFFNNKPAAARHLVKVIADDATASYTRAAILKALPPVMVQPSLGNGADRGMELPPDNWRRIDEAMQAIDPDCDYDEWLKVGQALHSSGDPRAFERWDSWSEPGQKYPGAEELERKWAGFGARRGITLATLFYIANQRGWRSPDRDWLAGVTAAGEEEVAEAERAKRRPTIPVVPGELPALSVASVAALRGAGVQLFQRGDNTLFRVLRIEKPEGSVRRPVGAVILRPVDPDWLRYQLACSANFVRWNARTSTYVPIDPKLDLAATLISAAGEMHWPYLRAVVQVPILTDAGELITAAGYHPESCLLLDLDGAWPEAASQPGLAEAIKARELLEDFMRHFPFAGPADEAVALSATLTALTRSAYPTAPMHCMDAPTAGTGKSLKVDADSILATGKTASVVDWGVNPEEAAKRLDAAQIAGDAVIAIDNVETPLTGSALCQLLTQTSRSVRILGQSKLVAVPCTATVTATGNNLVLREDVVRRALVCRMDPKMDRPELRDIEQNLLKEAAERRVELVMAGLTIVRAYILAGRPYVGISPLGSFEDWSRTVRAALVWTGAADPCETMTRSRDLDPSRREMEAVFTAWHRNFSTEGATATEAIARAATDPTLSEALTEVCQRRGALNPRALGTWLSKHRDSRVGDLVLVVRSKAQGIARWCVGTR